MKKKNLQTVCMVYSHSWLRGENIRDYTYLCVHVLIDKGIKQLWKTVLRNKNHVIVDREGEEGILRKEALQKLSFTI